MCHVLLQEWNRKCKFILHCALMCLETVALMGALYLEARALGVILVSAISMK